MSHAIIFGFGIFATFQSLRMAVVAFRVRRRIREIRRVM